MWKSFKNDGRREKRHNMEDLQKESHKGGLEGDLRVEFKNRLHKMERWGEEHKEKGHEKREAQRGETQEGGHTKREDTREARRKIFRGKSATDCTKQEG